MRAEQIHLHAEQISVAAAVVDDRFYSGLFFDKGGERNRAHPSHGARTVRDIYRVHAVFVQKLCMGNRLFCREPHWRIEFNAHRKLFSEPRGKYAFLRSWNDFDYTAPSPRPSPSWGGGGGGGGFLVLWRYS